MSATAVFLSAAFDSQGSLFAAVYQGIDSYRLRVVPTTTANAALAQDFTLDPKVKVSTVAWTSLPSSDKSAQLKKRKKVSAAASASNGATDSPEVVVLGTTQGTVLIYSPATSAIVNTLKTGSSFPIVSVLSRAGKLFVLQKDSTLTEFDLSRMTLSLSSVTPVPEPTAMIQPFENQNIMVIGNTQPQEVKNNEVDVLFNGFATPIAQLLPLTNTKFAALSAEDRHVFVYEQGQPKPLRSLVCPTTNAISMSCSEDGSVVAVTSEDGKVHLFDLTNEINTTTTASKKGRHAKAVPQVSASFSIDVSVVKRGTPLPVYRTKFEGPSLILAWPEQGSVPVFDTISWKSDGSILTTNINLEKAPAAPSAQENLIGGVDPAAAPSFSEGTAKVVSGADMGDLSDVSDDETLAEKLESLEVELNKKHPNGSDKNKGHNNKNGSIAENGHNKSASGGSSELNNSGETASSRLRRKDLQLKLSQPGSFATLLNQALTLSDKQLLEICLEERDAAMIKTSIVKLDPVLAASLLEHLAATVARSHNRSTTLAQWIRWTVVIHGAYLVTVPNLLRTLAGLHSTLSTRAATLPRLLALQGRLELLEEQLAVRNEYAAAQAAAEDDADEPEVYYDEEEAMIVNGEEANDDDDDDEEVDEDMDDDDSEMGDDDEADIYDADEIALSE